jgi:hypothetical protein
MRYLQLNNRVYYANGHETGFIENGSNNSWVMGTYYGPETDRQFVDPPLGSRLAFHGGSIWVTQGGVAWHSEPFGFNWFDLARNFLPFEGEIRMFRPVTSGIFVSLEDKTLFIEGTLSNDMKRRRTVANYPAIEDTDVELDASKIGSDYTGGDLCRIAHRGVPQPHSAEAPISDCIKRCRPGPGQPLYFPTRTLIVGGASEQHSNLVFGGREAGFF